MPTSRPGRLQRLRIVGYWFFTLTVAWEMVAGSIWDLLQIDYVRGVMTHLGYPLYTLTILGAWKVPCAVAVLVPRFPRLKEWAYAGAVFNYTGAVASHFLVGDGVEGWIGPLVFTAGTLASWALRPPDRRLAPASPATELRPISWMIPLGLIALFAVLALLTLPDGSPPP
jgi:hypothetical protein